MKIWSITLAYFGLSAFGFIGAKGRLAGLKLILCGPAASFSYFVKAITSLSDPEFAVSWRQPDIYKSIALHGGIWLIGLSIIIVFKLVGWKPLIAVGIAWGVAVPINLFYEMAQNV